MIEAAWIIPAFPLAGFVLLTLFGRRLGEPGAGWLGTLAVAGSFAATCVTFVGLLRFQGDERSVTDSLFTWIHVGRLEIKASLLLDPLSITMALFVTGVSTLIHLYSVGYMHGDERYPRFFVYLNLFVFSMLMLVLADNFVLTFLGWEGVGACSYLLISFWFERETAATAGKKAFVTNRIGDFGFLLATFLIFGAFGSLNYVDVLPNVDLLSVGTATAIGLLLFLGACGKSAQLPLYVWLPDAMEGPTPVSALIHAATMVTAGVYLMVRISPILHVAPDVATVIAIVGGATALFAATIACAQNDIKRVLAYSTISQLGYMFLAVGSGAYVAAVFHMITHAFFKALLFLAAGAVIHGMHDEQDMKRMGALRRLLPITWATFIVGWLAISGVPPFAGFWSKDEILINAWDKSPILWAVGTLTALLTAYYMTRQVMLVFYGESRWSGDDSHAGDPHEAPPTMTIPLVVLAVAAVVAGALNLPFGDSAALGNFLDPVIHITEHELLATGATQLVLAAISTAAALTGLFVARSMWSRRSDNPSVEPAILQRAWRVDEGISAVVGGPGRELANWSAYSVDKGAVDGAYNGVGVLVRRSGDRLRLLQTGYVRNYALAVAGGAVALLTYVVIRASG
ncbi:MAG: NADH-quinone oxidoreductase subunit L [Actinobacteria bacterium]|nr:NADH-quinone oxidoreductase subunit L [Actinomycetota bacterium]